MTQWLWPMNIKKSAQVLENFYEDFKDKLPLTFLPNKTVAYKEYVIRPKKDGSWQLLKKYSQSLQEVDTFNLKSVAIICARYHEANSINSYIETKRLDDQYFSNHQDAVFFQHFYKKTSDPIKKDNYLWRYDVCSQRATYYKDKISNTFKLVFR